MAGMLQIITYLLCISLVFKGFEIYQIAITSTKEKKTTAIAIGTIAIIASVIIAVCFVQWIDQQAGSIQNLQ